MKFRKCLVRLVLLVPQQRPSPQLRASRMTWQERAPELGSRISGSGHHMHDADNDITYPKIPQIWYNMLICHIKNVYIYISHVYSFGYSFSEVQPQFRAAHRASTSWEATSVIQAVKVGWLKTLKTTCLPERSWKAWGKAEKKINNQGLAVASCCILSTSNLLESTSAQACTGNPKAGALSEVLQLGGTVAVTFFCHCPFSVRQPGPFWAQPL